MEASFHSNQLRRRDLCLVLHYSSKLGLSLENSSGNAKTLTQTSAREASGANVSVQQTNKLKVLLSD